MTCIDKANVIGGFFYFRQIFDEVAGRHADLTANHMYVDACALNMVRRPWMFDVMVTENMFGDILSDLGAGLMGGMGMAPSADIGERHAVFQPCHGSAPDIVGRGLANPTATFLSAAMMLEWLGDQHGVPDCGRAGPGPGPGGHLRLRRRHAEARGTRRLLGDRRDQRRGDGGGRLGQGRTRRRRPPERTAGPDCGIRDPSRSSGSRRQQPSRPSTRIDD